MERELEIVPLEKTVEEILDSFAKDMARISGAGYLGDGLLDNYLPLRWVEDPNPKVYKTPIPDCGLRAKPQSNRLAA
jgi:hypothetical protein